MDLSAIPPYVLMIATVLFPLFLIGASVGSMLNVCIYRIPYEKSIIWPSSRCGQCYQRIRWYDNIPLISYWVLGGRCRQCKSRYSIRYFLIELMVGLAFPGLFYLEVLANPQAQQLFGQSPFFLAYGQVGFTGYVYFAFHALLLSFLIVTALTDIDHMEIPLSVTLTGTAVGLIGSVLFPWPWPADASLATGTYQPLTGNIPVLGLYPWPVWYPLPSWLPPGSPLLGLATGVAGVVAGAGVPRVVAFLFKAGRGKEGLGIGDADLMMMVGAFLGWQVVIVAFFVAVLPALFFGVVQIFVRGDRPMPFGPSLAAGSVITWLCWRGIGATREIQLAFFEPVLLGSIALVFVFGIYGVSWLLWLIRGPDQPEPEENPSEAEKAAQEKST